MSHKYTITSVPVKNCYFTGIVIGDGTTQDFKIPVNSAPLDFTVDAVLHPPAGVLFVTGANTATLDLLKQNVTLHWNTAPTNDAQANFAVYLEYATSA